MGALLPPVVFTAIGHNNVKLAELLGLLVGAVTWYFVPPRSSLRGLVIAVVGALILGILGYLIR